MAENKRCKLTIDYDGRKEELECRGFAGVVIDDTEGGFESSVTLVGHLSVKHLIALANEIEENLLLLVKAEAVKAAKCDPAAILKALLG